MSDHAVARRRTASAAVWLAAGQVLGLLWAALLLASVDIDTYGRFATGLAASVVVMLPLDAYFVVRAPRIDDRTFVGERSTRTRFALLVTAVGVVCLAFPWGALPGLVLASGGTTVVLNALLSQAIRDGHPERAVRAETVRRVLSLACGGLVVLAVPSPGLRLLVSAYLLGYLPYVVTALRVATRPALLPRADRRAATIIGDALGGAAYLQGDVLLVSALLGAAAAGRYNVGVLVATVAGAIGLHHAAAYHTQLRAAGGDPGAGPTRLTVLAGAAGLGVATLLGAVVAGVALPHQHLTPTLLAFAPVAATRFVAGVLTGLLVSGGRDRERLRITLTALVVKAVGIVALAHVGTVGAACGYLLGDLVMVAAATSVLRRRTLPAEVSE